MNLTKAELWELHWNYLRLFTLVTNMRKMFAQRLTARGTKSFVHISVLHKIPGPLFVLSFSRIDPIYNAARPLPLKRSRIDLAPTAFQYTSILWSLDNEMLSRIRNKQVTLLELEKPGI
jgi:hypothetical protein